MLREHTWRHQFNLVLSGLQRLSTANPGLTLFVCVNKAIGIEEQPSSCTSLDCLQDIRGYAVAGTTQPIGLHQSSCHIGLMDRRLNINYGLDFMRQAFGVYRM